MEVKCDSTSDEGSKPWHTRNEHSCPEVATNSEPASKNQ